MVVISKAIFCFCIFVTSAGITVAKEWRGIVPLYSTRADVTRLLGPSPDANHSRANYSLEKEDVYIFFANQEPYGLDCVKRLPQDIVLTINISPKSQMRIPDLQLDMKKFRKFDPTDPPGLGYAGYIDEEEGIIIKTNGEWVEEVVYIAAAKDTHLCPDFYERPEKFVHMFVDFDFPPHKFDEYGTLSLKDEKAHLDELAIQLEEEPGAQAYIIAYAGRLARPGEANERARRAKIYLEKEHKIDPNRITIVDGGRRESKSVELWVVRTGAIPPTATPTIKPSDIKNTDRRKVKLKRKANS